MILKIDWENNAEKFWDELRLALRRGDGPSLEGVSLRRKVEPMAFDGEEVISGTDEEIDAIIAWLETIPGYSDGPEYAKTALMLCEDKEE